MYLASFYLYDHDFVHSFVPYNKINVTLKEMQMIVALCKRKGFKYVFECTLSLIDIDIDRYR
jgi:hypothetical protein